MKICLTSSEYSPETEKGGIGTYTNTMAHALARIGHEVHVISMSQKRAYDCSDGSVYVHRFKYKKRVKGRTWNQLNYSLKVYRMAAKLIREKSIEIIESPEYLSEGYFLSKIKICPLVVKCHTPSFLISRLYQLDVATPLRLNAQGLIHYSDEIVGDIMEKSTIRSADKVTSCSMALAKIISKECMVDLSDMEVIPNGVNIRKFDEVKDEMSFRLRYRVHELDPVILYVGRLERRKGIRIIAGAIRPILKSFPNVHFVFVGKDSFEASIGKYYEQYIRQMIGKRYEENIIFTGYLSEANKIRAIKSCDLFIIPSLWENFPYVCLEAMACGKTVIGTKFGGLKEIIIHGENGLLFDPYRSDELKACITSLLKDKEKTLEMGKTARKTIETRFPDDNMAKETIKVYNEVLSV